MNENYFAKLNSIDVGDKVEQKNGLTYLSWAWAWGEIKKQHPDATYTIYENGAGWFYHTDGKTCWVKTGMTVNGIEHVEYLPVMDYKNKSIAADGVTSFDVNKAIQRSLTKAAARHGLGLYIYAGEDLPESEQTAKTTTKQKEPAKVTVDQTATEMQRRGAAIKELFERFGYLQSDYQAVSIELKSKNPREMTTPEFNAHLATVEGYLTELKQ